MTSLILSGGVGTRLWPVSREKLPKQFSPLFEQNLFVKTFQRLKQVGDVQVCTSEKMRGLTETALRKNQLVADRVYYEPMGRNTAPAIAIACQQMSQEPQREEVFGVFPSDHWIDDEKSFFDHLELAQLCAQEGHIVTLGIQPTYPATGFGYIERSEEACKSHHSLKAFMAKGFKEKPNLNIAEEYLKAGCFSWNSGIFVFKASTMIEAFEKHMPKMWQQMQSLKSDMSNITEIYSELESQSIDYGVMEKISNHVNIPCDMGWNDLGSWDDIAKLYKQHQFHSGAELTEHNAKDCFAYSDDKKTVAVSGVDNLIIVDTSDALLVTQKGTSQDVKQIVDRLKTTQPEQLQEHTYEYRPWGMYRNLYEEENFKSKVIVVDGGQQLSYQSHSQRSEIWVTVEGEGEVVLNDEVITVSKGFVVTIPQGAKHRMRNTGKQPLKFIEVQLGDYFGEDDIVRYSDDYNRT